VACTSRIVEGRAATVVSRVWLMGVLRADDGREIC
jgi:hypothetical protein